MDIIALDVHAHLVPAAPDELADIGGVEWYGSDGVMSIDSRKLSMKALFRPADLLAWMDRNRVGRAWISAPPPAYRPHLEQDATRTWSAYLNRGLARIAASTPRLEAMAHLPVEHPMLAAEIVQAAVAAGQTRFSMSTGGPGVVLSRSDYNPLWQALGRAKAFLLLHPGESADARFDAFYLHNLLGNPTETAIAASHLVLGGALERNPEMTICLAHAGGTSAMVASRLQRGYETKRPGMDLQLEPPLQSFKRLWCDSISHGDPSLALAAEVFGKDHIVFGSDWPFPMGLLEPQHQLAQIEPALKSKIFSGLSL